jgi:hypothetical protein
VYETSATVQARGELHLGGLPFPPGTEVKVTNSPKGNGARPAAPERVARLFAALDHARNVKPIGRLKREELHDRNPLD